MARSSYIYVVQSVDKTVLAAFTVKYECRNWLAAEIDEAGNAAEYMLDEWTVSRLHDGGSPGGDRSVPIRDWMRQP